MGRRTATGCEEKGGLGGEVNVERSDVETLVRQGVDRGACTGRQTQRRRVRRDSVRPSHSAEPMTWCSMTDDRRRSVSLSQFLFG